MEEDSIPEKIEKGEFQEKILDWYHKNKRSMPWRKEPTPYHVWISEIMLQQTRVEAMREYYQRFMERLPDIKSLAEVGEEELHKLWEGLGYYNRAKNLKKTALLLEKEYGGELPDRYEELLKLHGIGPYTAGAIASIAFRLPVPAVDGNVMRVIARLTGDDSDVGEVFTRKTMEEVVRKLIPVEDVHHFNQALMELGALVCVPNGRPKCEVCPVKGFCFAYENDKQGEFPVKKGKKERKKEKWTILLFKNGKEEFCLRKREEKGLLSGLWEFPAWEGIYTKKELKERLEEEGIAFLTIKRLERAKHVFSHIEWEMQGYLIILNERKKEESDFLGEEKRKYHSDGGRNKKEIWASFIQMRDKYSIPSAFRTYVKWIEKNEEE